MAEAVVSFVVRKLSNLLIEEALLLHGVHDKIDWIERQLKQMQCFLKDADAKQKGDERIRNWVAEIRGISYDAEDVVDTFISSVAPGRRRQGFVRLLISNVARGRRRQRFVGLVKRYMSFIFIELIARHKAGKEIRRIKMRISDVSSSRLTYGITDINEGRELEATSTNQNLHDHRRYFALLEEPDVVGFEEDRKTLKEQLTNGDSRRAVISIVGMGGSGKTTLTKKVYHDVKNDFDCHAFIYLSQQYKIRDIFIRIIQCVMSGEEMDSEKANEQDLAKKLIDHLSGKRYLVVIDDIWTMEAWNALNLVLPDGSNKSRVMLTTRIREVALHADSLSHPHEIHLLDDRESWELFLKKVFPQGSPCPSELEELGRKILEKCGRLPLPIVVLGGLLSRRDKTLSSWTKVLDSVTWHLAESSDKCMEILALSYYDLPHYLKPCFLYLGLFPEDFEIKSKRLIRLWIAEGFIQQRGNEVLEDVAEDYLEELIGRSMLQVASKRYNGSVSTCRIHDLLRELSLSEAEQNNFFEILRDDEKISSSSSKPRRLSLQCNTGKYDKIICHSKIRSVLCFLGCELDLSKLFSKGKNLLRVLDVEDTSTFMDFLSPREIPKEIGEFVHLRYLNFGRVFKAHPTCFTILDNLQTLKFKFNTEMVLPNAITNLERLRHLHAYRCKIEGQPRLNKLRNLQTLCLKADSWIENGLDKLTNLRQLGMFGDIGPYSNLLSHSIEKLCSLRSLTIVRNNSVVPFMSLARHLHLYKLFLEGPLNKLPVLPPSLMKLTLFRSQLQEDDIRKLGKLPELRYLCLGSEWTCIDKWICIYPEFPKLETLSVDQENLKKFIIEEGAMPCLKNKSRFDAKNLKTDPTKKNSLRRSQNAPVIMK